MARVYLSLGSNAGDRAASLREAIRRLRAGGPEITFVTASPLFEAEPWESEPGQPSGSAAWYLNCAAGVETTLPPLALLDRLHAIEAALGRERPAGTPEAGRHAPRPLDIDVLLYDDRVVSVPDRLQIPHLLMHERGFVLRPLADLAPGLEHPALHRTIAELLDALQDPHEVRPADAPRRWFED